jgi:CarboxypepD_reg-like domain/TonB-dependent Receptor Plug Domain
MGYCMDGFSKKVWVLVFCSSLVCLGTTAQKKISEKTISLDVSDVPLSEVLQIISKQSGIPFSYNPKRIDVTQKISYKAINKLLTEILNDLSQKVGISYTFVEEQIILKPEKNPENTPTGQTGKTVQHITLSGYLRDGSNGEALIGASVMLLELQTGAASNAFGFYSITVPKGIYSVTYSFIGFQDIVKIMDLSSSVQDNVYMMEEAPVLQPVVVTSDAAADEAREIQLGKNNLRSTAVEQRPALFGEMDVVKSLESVPGIKMHSEGSTFYSVRGGDRDQNLVLIDDAPVYNPSHILGFFSTIIPDVVNNIAVYKGDMPASIGGRLSSVMHVRTKKGNDQHLQAWGNFSLISTKLGIEGPIKKDASSFLVSARLSRLKWFFKKLNNDVTTFGFHDITGKLNFKLNPKNNMFFSFYTGSDNYFVTNSGIAWANSTGTLRWNHLINNRLFMNTTLAVGRYDYALHSDVSTNSLWKSSISNVTLKTDFSYFINPQHDVTFGLALNGYNFNPGNFFSGSAKAQISNVSVRNSTEFVLYGHHEINLSSHWGLSYGLRFSSWNNHGDAFEFIFDKNRNPIDTLFYKSSDRYANYIRTEPRLTARYMLTEKSSLKATFSRNVQNIHLITNSISPFTSMEVWLPSSTNIKPQTANQVTLGYFQSLPKLGASFTAEMFYKKMYHQIGYDDHAAILLNPLMERELRVGVGTSHGLELQMKKDEGRLRGWLGYSYSRARQQFAEINGGKPFNSFYDRPHQVNLILAYDVNPRWKVGINWNYSAGAPFTAPIGFYSFNDQEIPLYGPKNSDRLPDFHRMDVSATWLINSHPEKKFQHSLTLSVYNLYARKNILFINYNKSEVSTGSFSIPSNLLDNDRVTSQYYLFGVVPSLSYNFKWR